MASVPLDDLPSNLAVPQEDLPEQLSTAPMVEQVASQVEAQKSPFEKAFGTLVQPTAPEDFSLGDVATSGLLGAGIGLATGGPIGAVVGGATGLTAGAAGEWAGTQGVAPTTRFGIELIGGGAPVAAKNLLQKFGSSLPIRNLAKMFQTPDFDPKIVELSKDVLFGKRNMPEGFTMENFTNSQAQLRQQYLGETAETFGTTAPDKKVSDILRQRLYGGLETARQEGNAFIKSPEFKALMEDLKDLRGRDMLDGTSLKSLTTILSEELSTRPAVRENASQDILNLIQNGGVYAVGKKGAEVETKTKINEATRNALKKRFDEYLQNKVGNKAYGELKAVEAAEFAAQARDEIPMILQSNFKYGSPEMESVLSSIKNSPEGKRDFANSVMQHLRSFDDEKKMMSEFSRLRPALKEAGVMSNEEISSVYRNIKSYEGLRDKAIKFKRVQDALTIPLISAGSAEVSNNRKFNPLSAFNM